MATRHRPGQRHLFHSLLLAVLITGTPARAEDFAVIAHAGTPVASVERSQLKGIFGLRVDKWPNDQAIRVFVMADNAPPTSSS